MRVSSLARRIVLESVGCCCTRHSRLCLAKMERGEFTMPALKRTLLAVLFALLLCPVLSRAQSLGLAKPEDVGLSRERLDRIASTLNADIAKGAIPGATLLIVRNGKIAFYESFGWLDAAAKTPMPKDAIFRI